MPTALDNLRDIKLYVIQSDFFFCGIELLNDNVIKVAPIVNYMIGWNIQRVEKYCKKRNWLGYYYP